MDVEFSLRWVDVDGVSTRVMEAGEGPPLVLSTGMSGHLECYAPVIKRLASDFRVIAYDTLGHGFTDKPNERYTLPRYASHVLGLLDALEIDRASLSGESLGAWISAWFSAEHPDRVERLVLNTPGNILAKPDTMAKMDEITRRAVAAPTRETVRQRLEWLFAPENRHMVTDELVDIRVAIYSQPEFKQAIENILIIFEPEYRKTVNWSEEWCSKIEAPTLIVWTSDDPTGGIDEGRLLQSWIPNSELVLIEGAGHWSQWERPDEFLRLHREFLLGSKGALIAGAASDAT